MKPIHQCYLYAFIDTTYVPEHLITDTTKKLCDGGADIIQLRAKGLPKNKIHIIAEQILPILSNNNIPLVINDHIDIAKAIRAQYCHLGQEDFFDAGFKHVSELPLNDTAIQIGLSSHCPNQAIRAIEAGACYLGVGPVFKTPTKPEATLATLDYVRWARANIQIPWFAIGGITLENLDSVLEAGARRICVVSAILKASDISKACAAFKNKLTSAKT